MTTMKSLAGQDTIRVMFESFKNGKKQCSVDITEWTPRQVGELIESQEYQGRTWEHQTIQSYKFPELGKEGER